MEKQGSPKKTRHLRIFAAGDSVDRKRNYYVPWDDLDSVLTDMTEYSRWLLITGPWQSGKSSFMHAIAEGAKRDGFHAVITTLDKEMVNAANNVAKGEVEAGYDFFDLLADKLEDNSRGCLHRGHRRGMAGVLHMFQKVDRDVVWFIDEASLLTDIRRASVIQTLLSSLRECKQECISRNPSGSYHLRSFVLAGTPKLTQIIGDLRLKRIEVAEEYRRSSVHWDPEDPLGNSVSPLSVERPRPSDALNVEAVAGMLKEYSSDHSVRFRLTEEAGSEAEGDAAIHKLSKSMVELTGGHKGMVGCCCEYLMRQGIETFTEWQRHLRIGHVSRNVFYSRAYAKVISRILKYSEAARNVVLECIETGSSTTVQDLFVVLTPLNDGVLVQTDDRTVALSCGLLLSAFLEDCSFAHLEALPQIDTFVELIHATFPYMNYERLLREEVLNANGQPSEYAWQCEFLLSLKFVLENGYKRSNYTIMVEAKKRDKRGMRLTRLDFILKNRGSPPKGFEVQGAGAGEAGRKSIVSHIRKSDGYRLLHGCEMSYVYFQYGDYGVDAKAVIEEEAPKFPHLHYWFAQFVPDIKVWNIEQLQGSTWASLHRDAATSFPRFMFQARRTI